MGATVVLVGRSRHADRLELARRLGVDRTVDSETEDVEAVVKSMTDGYGAHSVFECSGAAGVLEGVAPLLRKGGRIVLVAFFHEPPSVDIDKLINNELELVGLPRQAGLQLPDGAAAGGVRAHRPGAGDRRPAAAGRVGEGHRARRAGRQGGAGGPARAEPAGVRKATFTSPRAMKVAFLTSGLPGDADPSRQK